LEEEVVESGYVFKSVTQLAKHADPSFFKKGKPLEELQF